MYSNCTLCERRCGKNRITDTGFCSVSAAPTVARAALHYWEEPIICGKEGSGAIFFSGCSLGCIYCQNREISRGGRGVEISEERLCDIMLELAGQGANNINFVTPTHYAPSVITATRSARARGLTLPIVYNTGTYETEETLESLKETVDIWLPDLKYYLSKTAAAYSSAQNLPQISRRNIELMVKSVGEPRFDGRKIMQKGVIVRLLVLPGHIAEAKLNISYLHKTYGDGIYMSIMSQYTPQKNLPKPLNRRLTKAEYYEVVDYAVSLVVKNAFTQDFESAEESFIPPFDNSGVL